MKIIATLLLILALPCASAQDVKTDGNWIKSGIDSFDRVFVTQNASEQDAIAGTELVAYVSGMLAVHRRNNLTALVLAAALNSDRQRSLTDADRAKVQTAMVFVPLLKVPDELSAQQVIAILRKFLAQNPSRWSEPAVNLIRDAFVSEFPRK